MYNPFKFKEHWSCKSKEFKGIITIIVFCSVVIQITSPIKIAFSITLSSIIVRILAYWPTSSIYPSCGVVISFSSGIIILFCYCAIINTHEKTPRKKKTAIIRIMVFITIFTIERRSTIESNTGKINIVTQLATTPLVAMGVIILAIVCINKRIFSPRKRLSFSY